MPRVKTAEQMLAELETLYRIGYRGHLDFVDDNFIGNKKAVKAFLPHLIAWQKERGYPFEFSTEASINIADDDALLALMREANFFTIFVGIESPDTDTLVSMQKKQNTRRSLADCVHKIYRAGMFVNAGFIVGFDSEKGAVAEAMIECIEATSIPFCMVGLLYALPTTQLTRRLAREGRLFPPSYTMRTRRRGGVGDQCTSGLNFATARPRRDILWITGQFSARVYRPAAYYARVRTVARMLDRPVLDRSASEDAPRSRALRNPGARYRPAVAAHVAHCRAPAEGAVAFRRMSFTNAPRKIPAPSTMSACSLRSIFISGRSRVLSCPWSIGRSPRSIPGSGSRRTAFWRKPAKPRFYQHRGSLMSEECTHTDVIRDVIPSALGCEECLKIGSPWVHLRLCRTCGHVGCCDNSPNRHATKHFHTTRHPIIEGYDPPEGWGWCYVDEVMLDLSDRATPHNGPVPRYY